MLLNPKKTQQSGGSHNVEDIDPFDAPVPGQSLTDEPGKWPWDKPPIMSDPDDAVEYVVQKIEDNQDTKDDIDKFLMAGTPVESIVNTIAFTGFAEGMWNPDIAEIIKFPLSAYFATRAIDQGYPLVMFNNDNPDEDVTDAQVIDTLRENNPQALETVQQLITDVNTPTPITEQSFLDAGPLMSEDMAMLEGEVGVPEEEQDMVMADINEGGMI
tara:strand:- start:96 stop:737 length:642 start_codon:yes stop_codon:yes gene_type:complete